MRSMVNALGIPPPPPPPPPPLPSPSPPRLVANRDPASAGAGVLVSGMSTSIAAFITTPIDMVKVRLQLQSSSFEARRSGVSVVSGIRDIVVSEGGVTSLWRGGSLVLGRAAVYGGLRLGLYQPIQTWICGGTGGRRAGIADKVAAGLISGTFSSAITSPLELVKVRVQAHPDHGYAKSGIVQTARVIVADAGVAALWKGAAPSVGRGAVLTASQCVTYERAKTMLRAQGGFEAGAVGTHVAASLTAGLVATTISNPFDVIKAYMFMHGKRIGLVNCVKTMLAHEGSGALLKGWTASYVRLAPLTTLIFVINEQLRRAFDIDAL